MSAKKYNIKGTSKQDLTAARAELKEFRRGVSLLKKKGLLDKKYDARSVTPTKYLKSVVKQFGNVLSGTAQPVKVSKEKQKYYAEKGYTVKNGRIIVPVKPNEKAYSTHGDMRVKTIGSNGSITRIDLGLSRNRIEQWANELKSRHLKLKPDERITFQLFGNNSYRSFSKLKQLIEYLEYYQAFDHATNSPDVSKQQEFIDGVVIYKVERNGPLPDRVVDPQTEATRKQRAIDRKNKWLDRMTPEQEQRYLANRALYQRERLQKLKSDSDPTKLLEKQLRARERAKKSYEAKKGKK